MNLFIGYHDKLTFCIICSVRPSPFSPVESNPQVLICSKGLILHCMRCQFSTKSSHVIVNHSSHPGTHRVTMVECIFPRSPFISVTVVVYACHSDLELGSKEKGFVRIWTIENESKIPASIGHTVSRKSDARSRASGESNIPLL